MSGIVVPGFAVPRVGGSEMEMESGETANRLERIVGETFKGLGCECEWECEKLQSDKDVVEDERRRWKFMSSMFM